MQRLAPPDLWSGTTLLDRVGVSRAAPRYEEALTAGLGMQDFGPSQNILTINGPTQTCLNFEIQTDLSWSKTRALVSVAVEGRGRRRVSEFAAGCRDGLASDFCPQQAAAVDGRCEQAFDRGSDSGRECDAGPAGTRPCPLIQRQVLLQ